MSPNTASSEAPGCQPQYPPTGGSNISASTAIEFLTFKLDK